MPNINNFATDTTSLEDRYSRYTVSRIIANKRDTLLVAETPAIFPTDDSIYNVEVHLYSLADSSLVGSFIVPSSTGAITLDTLEYEDGSVRRFVVLDFTKLGEDIDVPIGQYSITMYFFADEVGSYNDRVLQISKISPSRKEVELMLTDAEQLDALSNFASPSISAVYAEAALKQILNYEGAELISIPASSASISPDRIYDALSNGDNLQGYGFDEDLEDKPGINTIAQTVMTQAYPLAKENLHTLIANGSTRITKSQLVTIVVEAMNTAYDAILEDTLANPQKYRFELL